MLSLHWESSCLLINQSLRMPPNGFDSVPGISNQSEIFVLYGVDVRRAYPAYEVIYKHINIMMR